MATVVTWRKAGELDNHEEKVLDTEREPWGEPDWRATLVRGYNRGLRLKRHIALSSQPAPGVWHIQMGRKLYGSSDQTTLDDTIIVHVETREEV